MGKKFLKMKNVTKFVIFDKEEKISGSVRVLISNFDIYPKEMALFNIKQMDKGEIMRFV